MPRGQKKLNYNLAKTNAELQRDIDRLDRTLRVPGMMDIIAGYPELSFRDQGAVLAVLHHLRLHPSA